MLVFWGVSYVLLFMLCLFSLSFFSFVFSFVFFFFLLEKTTTAQFKSTSCAFERRVREALITSQYSGLLLMLKHYCLYILNVVWRFTVQWNFPRHCTNRVCKYVIGQISM